MSIEKPITFEDSEYKIPIKFKETVGTVTFVAVRTAKYLRDEDGQLTDEMRAQSIEVSSEKQRETFNVDLPPAFKLEDLHLKFGDTIEVDGVDTCEAWAQLAPDDNNVENAMTGFTIKADSVRKVQVPPKQTVQENSNRKNDRKEEKKES